MFTLRALTQTRLAGARSFSATAAAASLSVNRAILVGNLASDLRVQELNESRTMVDFTLATNRVHRNREGELVRETDWHRVRSFVTPARANYFNEALKKGNVVMVEGSIRYNSYTDKEGQEKIAMMTKLIVNIDKVQNFGEYRRQPREEGNEEGSDSRSDF
ncbi:hypothetical protein BDF19DRAFT_439028 [Syncephalis fuscata]|nr:hypothetical protein BDF19DRAFT_439028 [Syncephalis fuscata]